MDVLALNSKERFTEAYAKHINALFHRASQRERGVLVLHEINKFSVHDIAAMIGKSLQTITQRLAAGLEHTRSVLHYA